MQAPGFLYPFPCPCPCPTLLLPVFFYSYGILLFCFFFCLFFCVCYFLSYALILFLLLLQLLAADVAAVAVADCCSALDCCSLQGCCCVQGCCCCQMHGPNPTCASLQNQEKPRNKSPFGNGRILGEIGGGCHSRRAGVRGFWI